MIDKILTQLMYNPREPMIFSSGLFLVLFLGFTFVYMLLQRKLTARLLFVTAFSYYFYYKSSGFYFFLLAVVTVSDYLIARSINANRENRTLSRRLVCLSLLIDLGLFPKFKLHHRCLSWQFKTTSVTTRLRVLRIFLSAIGRRAHCSSL